MTSELPLNYITLHGAMESVCVNQRASYRLYLFSEAPDDVFVDLVDKNLVTMGIKAEG